MASEAQSLTSSATQGVSRAKKLQLLGILSGFTAGAWLGAAEAPTKLVSIGISPIAISLIMVIGVFLARWSLPALILGTSSVRADVRRAPHLIIWAVLAGCLWAVANTLTIFAIRDIGLSIAFPLWNSNSLLGILWGFLFFNELRQAGWRRWVGVLGGALIMCAGATLLAIASSSQAPAAHPMRGVCAALGAGVLWGTMYIPYRKAYLTGMNPLSFVTFFTFGELGMMTALALTYTGAAPLWQELSAARAVLFWLMLGGLIWVIGDLFQQYAAKYVGISRGIPLSNTNQLWGLLWGVLVFGELRGEATSIYVRVILGSLITCAGAAAIAFSSAPRQEHELWQDAAFRQSELYVTKLEYVRSGLEGREFTAEGTLLQRSRHTILDWILLATTVLVFTGLFVIARAPMVTFNSQIAIALLVAMVAILAACGTALWRITRFN